MDNQATNISFIICPPNFRISYLKSHSIDLGEPVRFYSKEDLIQGLYFSTKESAIVYLMEKYGFSYALAKERLNDLFFLPQVPIGNVRIDQLISIKADLENQQLLAKSPYFSQGFEGKFAKVIGYHHHDKELHKLAKILGLQLVFETPSQFKKQEVFAFSSIQSEVDYFFNAASELIDNGVNINDIYVVYNDTNYHLPLLLGSHYFQMPINLPSIASWGATPLGQMAQKLFNDGQDIGLITAQLKQDFAIEDTHTVLLMIQKASQIKGSPATMRRYLKALLDQTNVPAKVMNPAIRILPSPYPIKGAYVFVLGANQGVIPSIHRDISFLNDEERQQLGRLTSTEQNDEEEGVWEYFLKTQTHLYISYHLIDERGQAFASPLINRLNFDKLTPRPRRIEFGRQSADIKLANMLDLKRVFHIDNELIAPYQKALNVAYRQYDYRFKPFDMNLLEAKLRMSYSRIDTFYQCRYRYYLDYVLDLEPFEGNFYTTFGSFAHAMLELSNDPDFDFDTSFNLLKNRYFFSIRDKAILDHLKPDLIEVISFNDEHKSHMHLVAQMNEVNLKFALDENTTFIGKIDKILLTQLEDKRFAAFVDYKTGDESFRPDKLQYGLSLQLPSYGLLFKRDPRFCDVDIIGYYIQNITPPPINLKPKEDYAKIYHNKVRLNGLSINNVPVLMTLDDTLRNSQYLVGIKISKEDKFSYPQRVFSQDDNERFLETTLSHINNAVKSIRACDFTINPRRIGKDYSCSYCPFRDMCFRPNHAVAKIYIESEDVDDGAELE
ncbi:MAG TPA: hypothetical protein DCM23_01525 [Firmicutes bacterium]|nr:hypothetical protein [Bacillota bacterium]